MDIQWKNNKRYPKIEVSLENVAHFNPKNRYYVFNDEVTNWLDDNEICYWMRSNNENALLFYFEDDADAIAFKMRWG